MNAGWQVVIGYLLVINLLTVLAYWFDKRKAKYGGNRIPEKSLFLLSWLGGTPGAFYASHKVRHKTKKRSYRVNMWFILVVQVAAIIYFIVK